MLFLWKNFKIVCVNENTMLLLFSVVFWNDSLFLVQVCFNPSIALEKTAVKSSAIHTNYRRTASFQTPNSQGTTIIKLSAKPRQFSDPIFTFQPLNFSSSLAGKLQKLWFFDTIQSQLFWVVNKSCLMSNSQVNSSWILFLIIFFWKINFLFTFFFSPVPDRWSRLLAERGYYFGYFQLFKYFHRKNISAFLKKVWELSATVVYLTMKKQRKSDGA